MVIGLEQEGGSFDYSHGAGISSLKAGRGISVETFVLGDVFPPDDLARVLRLLYTYHTL